MAAQRDAAVLSAAREVAEAIPPLANEIEAARQLPRPLVEQMRAAGLFHLTVPADIGGQQVHPKTMCQVIETVSAADGSAGWCLMIAAQNAAFSGFMDQEAARQVYSNGQIVAGVARPIGRAVPKGDGFVVSGRWPFASGSPHADWFGAECLIYPGDGDQPLLQDGQPVSFMASVPRDRVTVHDTWYTTGLRGSGSHDFSVDGADVPGLMMMKMLPEPVHPWTFYRTLTLMFTSHGAQSLGMADAAIRATIHQAQSKIAWGTDRPIAAQPRLQGQVAEALVLVESAREHLYGAIDRLWSAAEAGEELGNLNARVRLATSHAATASRQAVDILHRAMSTSSILAKDPLERIFRDMHTASAHVMVGPLTYEAAGRVELGLPSEMAFF